MTNRLRRVFRYAKRWGVEVQLRDAPILLSSKYSPAPFTRGGIDGNVVYWQENNSQRPFDCWALMHEISHVIVGVSPSNIDEIHSAMLALDYYGGGWLRMSGWTDWMGDYYFEDNDSIWRTAPPGYRGHLIAASLYQAVTLGLFDERGRPTFERSRAGRP